MQTLPTRRRARRRSVNRRLVVFGSATLVTLLVIGGLTQVARNSGPYTAQMSRSFAGQVSVLARASNVTAASVRSVMSTMPNLSRQKLQIELDGAVQQTQQQETAAATFARPVPPGSIAAQFATIFPDRAQAMLDVRAAVDGLLGMHPLAVAGAAGGQASLVSTPTLITSSEATNRIAAAGALLARSDRAYAAVRRDLLRSAGHAVVPPSVWITDGQTWQVGALATQVDLVESSASLVAVHQLAIASVRITPPALPPPSGAVTPGTSTLSPTTLLSVSVVLSNQGTVDEPRSTLHITLTSQSTGRTVTVTRVSAVGAGRSLTLAPANFGVTPGRSYQLSVTVALPPAQTSTANTAVSQLLLIAPPTPPTTTTTVPPRTTTTARSPKTTTTTSAR